MIPEARGVEVKKKSKRYRKGLEQVEAGKLYPLADALKVLKELPPAKFDETVELAFFMGCLLYTSDAADE